MDAPENTIASFENQTNRITFSQKASPLIDREIPVFPCGRNKTPSIREWPRKASTNPGDIEGWSSKFPGALVGVPTGEASGFLVLDIDTKNGKDGFETLNANGWDLPITQMHKTRSGNGKHCLFKYTPEIEDIRSNAGVIGEGLDIRTHGGYIIWWPAEGTEVENEGTIAEVPSWLIEAAREGRVKGKRPSNEKSSGDKNRFVLPDIIGEGERNCTLTSYAGQLKSFGKDEAGIEAALLKMNEERCHPPLGKEEVIAIAEWTNSLPDASLIGGSAEVTSIKNGEEARVASGKFRITDEGVFYIGFNNDGVENKPLWLCSPLRVVAETRDNAHSAFGRLLEWEDSEHNKHQWPMPMELVAGEAIELRAKLLRDGLRISPIKKAREKLTEYLQVWPTSGYARSVEHLGWYEGVFLLPGEVIGQPKEIVLFQNPANVKPAYSTSLTLEDWRAEVAAWAAGNSRLVLAISTAFAAPLLELVGGESGGFHFRGDSSTGKTTAQHVAASVWGNPEEYIRTWRATANGLEGVAALHNDGLLILDELSQVDSKQAGEVAYMLANGQGKSRATRNGSARGIASWRLLFLSSGEVSLSAMMQRANQKAQAGQEVRMLDIEADAGAGMGVFEDIHGAATPADFAGALKDASKKQYGMVGMKYLQKLAEEHASLGVPLKKLIEEFVERVLPNGASGQVTRAANRFALCAVAGELATRYGLTGWPIGSATNAAEACFKSWYVGFGGAGNKEDRGILAQVRGFFELHGNGRFENLDSYSSSISERVHNRAGFFRNRAFPPLDKPVREYLVLTEVFKAEICEGYDARKVGRVLREAGWLNVGEGTHLARHETLPGLGRTRCYVFNHEMWDSDALSDIH